VWQLQRTPWGLHRGPLSATVPDAGESHYYAGGQTGARGVPKGHPPRLIPTRNRTAPGGPDCGLPPAGGREGGMTESLWLRGDIVPVA